MIRTVFRQVGFERLAVALTGACIAFLYVLVALDFMRGAPAETQDARQAGVPAIMPADGALRTVAADAARLLKPIEVFSVASAEKLTDVFSRIGYRLEHVREHGQVPRVFLASIPADLPRIRLAEQRKIMFIQTALPLILHVNEVILHDRERIKALRAQIRAGETLDDYDREWLESKADEYGLDTVDFDRLLRRVDIIPPSLALAQSAEESGWGTSRFAQEGNALFGQRVWKPHRKGIVPEERPEGEQFRVRAFDHLIDGVKSYARNLNIHRAYDAFRSKRAALRREGAPLDGGALAGTLEAYSERGADYVGTLMTIIRVNGLALFDGARLGDRITLEEVPGEPPDA